MFTGIVSDIGTVQDVVQLESGKRFTIASNYDTSGIDIGASIAHNGVCLTVVGKTDGTYQVEAWEEALRLTTADGWQTGTRLNLERALKLGDELGGHMVSGHVDGHRHDCRRQGRRGGDPLYRQSAASPRALHRTEGICGVERHIFDHQWSR